MKPPLPAPAVRGTAKLGQDLSRARRRRRLTQASMAERAGIGVATLKRLERGDPSVGLDALARVLVVLGMIDRLAELADTGTDDLGLALMDDALPKRVRPRTTSGAM